MNELESASLARLTARPEPAANNSSDKHSAESKESQSSTEHDSFWNKASREAYVVGGGLLSGITENAQEAIHNPSKSLPELGIAVGTGALLALAHGKKGLIGLGAKVIGLGFAVGFVKDLTDAERLSGIGNAVSDTWKSAAHLDQNRDAIKHHAGQFAFDTALMIAGGSLGAGAMRYGRMTNLPYYLERTPTASGSMSLNADGMFGKSRHVPAFDMVPEGPMVNSRYAQLLETIPAKNGSKAGLEFKPAVEKVTFPSPNGKHTIEWKPSNESFRVRQESQQFVESLKAGDYMGALNVAVESPSLNGVELNPAKRAHAVTIRPSEFNDQMSISLTMDRMGDYGKFAWDQTSTISEVMAQKLTAIVPKVLVELRAGTVVPLVDFVPSRNGYKAEFPSSTVSGAVLSAADAAQMQTLRQSPGGQRLIGETAIIAFEEATVHANQHSSGGILSPTFAEFSKKLTLESGYETRSHLLALLNTLSRQDKNRVYIFEQEVPALLYDAGMPLSMIKHHYFFGARHVQERTPVMEFLDRREAQ